MMTRTLLLLSRFLVLLMMLLGEVAGSREPTNVYWNTSNPAFRSTANPAIEVNGDTGPWQFDQINIVCPSGPGVTEKHIIYSVTKDEFDSCEVWSSSPKIVAVCDHPSSFLYFTITFRYFSPSPRQLEFKPGETYFFISTSRPGDLGSMQGGYCRSNNMKIKFRIAEKSEAEENLLHIPVPTAFWSKYWRSRIPDGRDIYSHNYKDDFRDLDLLRGNERLPYKSGAILWTISVAAAIFPILLVILM